MRKIFLDCGAWNGQSVKVFRKVYDPNYEYEIYSFEPNPLYKDYFKKFQRNVFSDKAIWIDDCERYFYLDYSRKKAGSTLIKEKTSGVLDKNNPIKVKCIDLDRWIKENFDKSDYIILKLDIEGAEYKVLSHMMKGGSMKYINKLFIEWHWHKIGMTKEAHVNLMKQIHVPIVERWKSV